MPKTPSTRRLSTMEGDPYEPISRDTSQHWEKRIGWQPSMQEHVDNQLAAAGRPRAGSRQARRLRQSAARSPVSPEQKSLPPIEVTRRLLNAGFSGEEIAAHLKVHLRTARRYIAKAKAASSPAQAQPQEAVPQRSPSEVAQALYDAMNRELHRIEQRTVGNDDASEALSRLARAMDRLEPLLPKKMEHNPRETQGAMHEKLHEGLMAAATAEREIVTHIYPNSKEVPLKNGCDFGANLGSVRWDVFGYPDTPVLYSENGTPVGFRRLKDPHHPLYIDQDVLALAQSTMDIRQQLRDFYRELWRREQVEEPLALPPPAK